MSKAYNERVPFKIFHMECCNHLLCWVNARYPSFCPQCGRSVYPKVKGWATIIDNNATLRVKPE